MYNNKCVCCISRLGKKRNSKSDMLKKLQSPKNANTFLSPYSSQSIHWNFLQNSSNIIVNINFGLIFQEHKDDQLFEVLHSGVEHRKKYPESVRKFCLALHYYSPRGYEYVRKTFNSHLPSSKTIQRWYIASDLRGEPGIQQETLTRLKTIADSYEKKNKCQLLCSLMIDEMYIRSQVFWSQQRLDYVGLAGIAKDSGPKPIGKQALVFYVEWN